MNDNPDESFKVEGINLPTLLSSSSIRQRKAPVFEPVGESFSPGISDKSNTLEINPDIDWEYWSKVDVLAWQGCLLSLGINPKTIKQIYFRDCSYPIDRNNQSYLNTPQNGPLQILHNKLREKFIDRMMIVESHRKELWSNSKGIIDIDHKKIKFNDFAKTVLILEWFEIPNNMKNIAQEALEKERHFNNGANISEQQTRWPWGSYETPLLQVLEATAKKFWTNYDPKDRTTAKTNKDVSKWIIDNYGSSGEIKAVGVMPDLADKIAQILRDPNLPNGRPRGK